MADDLVRDESRLHDREQHDDGDRRQHRGEPSERERGPGSGESEPQIGVADGADGCELEQREGPKCERRAATQEPAGSLRQRVGGRRFDSQLRAHPKGRDAEDERQVAVDVHEPGHPPLQHGGVDEVEVNPPETGGDREASRRNGGGAHVPAGTDSPEDDGEHGLAEHDDREEPEPLGDVRCVDGRLADLPPAEERRGQLDEEPGGPHRPSARRRCRCRYEPEDQRHREGRGVHGGEPSGLGDVSPGPRVERDQDEPNGHVGEHEGCPPAAERVADVHGESRDGEHAEERPEPVDDVVRVEAVGVEREPHPCPPDRDEESEEVGKATAGRVGRQLLTELRDRNDEDQVEEELEPGGTALGVVLVQRPKPRRRDPGPGRHALVCT